MLEIKKYARVPNPNDPFSRGVPIGLVIARLDNSDPKKGPMVKVGWSLVSKNDSFSYSVANDIAESRIDNDEMVFPLRDSAKAIDAITPDFAELKSEFTWVLKQIVWRQICRK